MWLSYANEQHSVALKCIDVGPLPAGNVSDLSSEMQLVPEPENPFAHHPAPLQAGRKLQAIGRSQDAALAFEAAGMVSYSCTSVTTSLPIAARATWGKEQGAAVVAHQGYSAMQVIACIVVMHQDSTAV